MTRDQLLCRAYIFEITHQRCRGRGVIRVGSIRLFLSQSDSALRKVPVLFRSLAASSDPCNGNVSEFAGGLHA